MLKSMLFLILAAAVVVCRATTESCKTDADCQASTNRCYFGRGTGGSCQCNPVTNAGCAENEICSDRPTWVDGFPACVDPSTLGPIGTICNVNEDCATKRCFQGNSVTKTCACNAITNAGCPEGQVCSDEPTYVDGFPECREQNGGGIGDECTVDTDCDSLRCFFGEQLPNTPGTCACNSTSNAGCSEGQVCSDEPTHVDGFPECREQNGGEIDDECTVDTDCKSARCWYSWLGPPTNGWCVCNSQTNAGCSEPKICSDEPILVDGFPECIDAADPNDLLPQGSPCAASDECQSGSCFFGMDPVEGELGFCQCNMETNAGCAEGLICIPTPRLLAGSSLCVDNFGEDPLPIGSDCWNDTQCVSENCWYGYLLILGRCRCNLLTNSGCGDSTPLCRDDPRIADEPPQCTAAGNDTMLDTIFSLLTTFLQWLLALF